MENLNVFYEVINNPKNYIEKWKKDNNKKVIGYFCSYTPEEIIYAADALPFRIFGSDGNISHADAHIQSYICSLVRGGLDDVLAGRLDFLDGSVFPHTCDSIQRLSDIWRLNVKNKFHADVVLPVKLNTYSAYEYMESVLNKFKKDIEDGFNIEISDEKLKKSIQTYNKIRSCFKILFENRTSLSSKDLYVISKASMIMDRDVVLENLLKIVEKFETASSKDIRSDSKNIILTGGICNMPDIYSVIERAGGKVVWDDFCTGSRYFEAIVEKDNPIKSITERYIKRINCPAKHSGVSSRGDYLIQIAKDKKADGVIFVLLKFCDPHAFDYPYIKDLFDKQGIKTMLVELGDQSLLQGQINTRCEAFIEML